MSKARNYTKDWGLEADVKKAMNRLIHRELCGGSLVKRGLTRPFRGWCRWVSLPLVGAAVMKAVDIAPQLWQELVFRFGSF